MFVCNPCHKKHYGEAFHFSVSYGPCELCKKLEYCYDCHGCTNVAVIPEGE